MLEEAKAKALNAYSYLAAERKIHPGVVADAMLGVVPAGLDIKSLFAEYIDQLTEARDASTKRPGRPQKSGGMTPQEHLAQAQGLAEKLSECVSRCAGWLAFFNTDASHRISAIRFRKPYAKEFRLFKPYERGGVFGLNLFPTAETLSLKFLDNSLLVTEGEFNVLQLQSLCRRRLPENELPAYVNACAVGGVSNADLRTIIA
ncbi:MAG: hypothetical protein KC649_08355, partial [Candidatus Omnitrophica bacterium]|nr:hypothetical protein [Candidatus Omnitrophota bacterium]